VRGALGEDSRNSEGAGATDPGQRVIAFVYGSMSEKMQLALWDEQTSVSAERLTVSRLRSVPPVSELVGLYLIGLASWLLVSGVFAAAVWHIDTAPEGSTLFAHLDVAVQAPNLIPAVLVLASPSTTFIVRRSTMMTAAVLALGVIGAGWLTAASRLRTPSASVGLILGALAGGAVGSTSMVVFFPLAAAARDASRAEISQSISAVSAGVGTCGVVAQVLSGLRVEGHAYFGTLLALQLLGGCGLALLYTSRRARSKANTEAVEGGSSPPALQGVIEVAVDVQAEAEPSVSLSPHCATAGAACLGRRARSWISRHVDGAKSAGRGALAAIGFSCVLEFAMPGLLPYLGTESDKTALFWLTFAWAVTSVVGRVIAARRALRQRGLVVASVLQAFILLGAIACAATESPPPLWVGAPMVTLFSVLHGLVVTSVFVLASARRSSGAAYAGLSNQVGALLGSLFSLALVSSGLIPKREHELAPPPPAAPPHAPPLLCCYMDTVLGLGA
jgi:hypothetical protein